MRVLFELRPVDLLSQAGVVSQPRIVRPALLDFYLQLEVLTVIKRVIVGQYFAFPVLAGIGVVQSPHPFGPQLFVATVVLIVLKRLIVLDVPEGRFSNLNIRVNFAIDGQLQLVPLDFLLLPLSL